MIFSLFSGPPARAKLGIRLAHYFWQLALVLCVVGLVPGLLALWGEQRTVAAAVWREPADDIDAEAIALDLTLLSLAGTPDKEVLALALEKGEGETVRALLAFSPDLSDQERLNGWLWLAQRYREAKDRERAAHAYRMVGTGAILADPLPDLLRVESLITAGRWLLALHDGPSASFYLEQAALIGGSAPRITEYHRRLLLERLVPLILSAGGEREAWTDLAQAVENGIARGGKAYYNYNSTDPIQSIELGVPKVFDAALIHARDIRRGTAADWLTALFADLKADNAVQLRQELSQALQTEDAAMAVYLQSQHNLEAVEAHVRWLLFKRYVISGAGTSGLMPDWTAQQEQICDELTAIWTEWLALQTDSTYRNPNQRAKAMRRALMAAYWGLYPDAPIADLVAATRVVPGPSRLQLTIIKSTTPPVVGWSEVTN